ncbi:hypothetical protein [Gorillibacterium sp. CAU 1737]|uniref:hypothetical protein n=1 Tax=Gorillibacterium sp. CAU 1737 TaxID=3140362 RepID=UPI003260C3AA
MRGKRIGLLLLMATVVLGSTAMAEPSPEPSSSGSITAQEKAKLLEEYGLSDQTLKQLDYQAAPLIQEISTKGLTKEQVQHYVDGILKANEQTQKIEANRIKGVVDESVQITREVKDGQVTLQNGSTIPVPEAGKASQGLASDVTLAHGPYYNVDAKVGYRQVTHRVDLPSVLSKTPSGIIPYVLGGAYVTNSTNSQYYGGVDVGAFYEAGVWRLAINGKNQGNTANYWTSSTATLPGGTLYLNYSVSANNQVQIIASDANYNYITSISYYFPDIYLKADGSNVEMATGFSMAYKNVKSLSDGSYLLNGHIYDAYVYNSSGYSYMNSSVVVHANKKGTADEQKKVSVNTVSNYYNYYVSIDLRP